MGLDFRNLNTLWASILVETLYRLGVTTAVICPGSRSAPLTIAFAQHPAIESIPILDERSASFFALGMAKRIGKPVVLICTSGTAGANFYPAVIEAKESRVPLLILTADRPPELRHCHGGQTIDQVKLYGNYPNWQAELALPSSDKEMLQYLRQIMIQAWEQSQFPQSGVVHINIPFRQPLSPIIQADIVSLKSHFNEKDFFLEIYPQFQTLNFQYFYPADIYKKGIIIAGVVHTNNPQSYCQAIAKLSQYLGYPVLAEALSPLRNFAAINPYLISTYDLILRNKELAEKLIPEVVIQLGELPTSKVLRGWLDKINVQRWIIDASAENFDPLHGKTIHIRSSIEALVNGGDFVSRRGTESAERNTEFLSQWLNLQEKVKKSINDKMESVDFLLEGKVAWLLSKFLPEETPIFIANSMSVRNVEFFWLPSNSRVIPYFNRGTNGIDGTLSTALGVAHRYRKSVVLTGDLSLLHDTNGFLIRNKFVGHLTIILINNNGGGIFEMLPISQFEPPFEEFFVTPQNIDFYKLCQTYEIEHKIISNWGQLHLLLNPLPESGIRVLEVPTNCKKDTLWLQNNLNKFAKCVP